jgi:hypothetical protein
VIDPGAPATLWVADPNPRAQAFYRKNGFVADGTVKTEDDVREVRMVRSIQAGTPAKRTAFQRTYEPATSSRTLKGKSALKATTA